jgi:hypothetical protein
VPEYRHHGQAAHATEKRKLANKMLGSFVSTAEARAMFVRLPPLLLAASSLTSE